MSTVLIHTQLQNKQEQHVSGLNIYIKHNSTSSNLDISKSLTTLKFIEITAGGIQRRNYGFILVAERKGKEEQLGIRGVGEQVQQKVA